MGWLYALADTQMSAAITAMHEDLAHRWTLRTLGERAGRQLGCRRWNS